MDKVQFLNLHVCPVHEQPACVEDLVWNLKRFDPGSEILIYDGSENGLGLDTKKTVFEGVHFFPNPSRQHWGRIHDFLLDCMEFCIQGPWQTITVVDSDQLLCRSGYRQELTNVVAGKERTGMLAPLLDVAEVGCGSTPHWTLQDAIRNFSAHSHLMDALQQLAWDRKLVWNFAPSTVYTRKACKAVLDLLAAYPRVLQDLSEPKLAIGEEIFLGTLIRALGFDVEQSCLDSRLFWRKEWCVAEVERLLAEDCYFWIHPVRRDIMDACRGAIGRKSLSL